MKALFPVLLLLLSSCTTDYYVVRHAEKINSTDTSSLTNAGKERAVDLKTQMLNKDILTIYASTIRRTQLTAQPLADALQKQIVLYRPDTSQKFAEMLKGLHGSSYLIVGHSNTVPVIVHVLSDETIPEIPDNDFDNLYHVHVVRRLGWTSRHLSMSTYGAPSP